MAGKPIASVRSSRITMPDETRRRIDELLAAGSTLTISDIGLGPETGDGTDFITITRADRNPDQHAARPARRR